MCEFKKQLVELLEELKGQVSYRNVHNLSAENCTGDFISNSNNVINGFNIINCEDCVDAYNSSKLKNCYGAYCSDVGEICIDCDTNYDLYECTFCTYVVGCKNIHYCDQCFYLKDCFGIPDNPKEIDLTICDKILSCEVTGKNYKIIPQELNFHKKFNLPVPRRCPEQRYRDLLDLQNPTKLHDAICSACNSKIQTTYRPDNSRKILCEECYLKEKY